jgi:hypothetical protein
MVVIVFLSFEKTIQILLIIFPVHGGDGGLIGHGGEHAAVVLPPARFLHASRRKGLVVKQHHHITIAAVCGGHKWFSRIVVCKHSSNGSARRRVHVVIVGNWLTALLLAIDFFAPSCGNLKGGGGCSAPAALLLQLVLYLQHGRRDAFVGLQHPCHFVSAARSDSGSLRLNGGFARQEGSNHGVQRRTNVFVVVVVMGRELVQQLVLFANIMATAKATARVGNNRWIRSLWLHVCKWIADGSTSYSMIG